MANFDYPSDVHHFMRSNKPLDEAGRAKLDDLATRTGVWHGDSTAQHSASFCLNSAVTYAQADKLAILVDDYGADLQQQTVYPSEVNKGQKQVINLLEDALQCYRVRPDTDHAPEGQARLLSTVSFLLQRGLSAAPNASPLESAIAEAYLLVHPAEEDDPASPLYSAWGAAIHFLEDYEPEAPFTAPYELLRQSQPEAVASFERALAEARVELSQHARDFDDAASGRDLYDSEQPVQEHHDAPSSTLRRIAHAIAPRFF